jgi:phage terminase Nu1 subunit (DNA packaging protein)
MINSEMHIITKAQIADVLGVSTHDITNWSRRGKFVMPTGARWSLNDFQEWSRNRIATMQEEIKGLQQAEWKLEKIVNQYVDDRAVENIVSQQDGNP